MPSIRITQALHSSPSAAMWQGSHIDTCTLTLHDEWLPAGVVHALNTVTASAAPSETI